MHKPYESNERDESTEQDEPRKPESAAGEEVFDYGDRTILQLRSQAFEPEGDFGTMLNLPQAPADDAADDPTRTRAIPMPQDAASVAHAPEDAIARLEQKLDLALRQIAVLQQRLESMDATLMKMLMR